VGRDPNEAFRNYVGPLRDALHCVTEARFGLDTRHASTLNKRYAVVLAGFNPVPLRSDLKLKLRVGNAVRLVEVSPRVVERRFQVETGEYFCELSVEDHEILTSHWTPEAAGAKSVAFPHIHIGSSLVADQRVIRPKDFHKVHIPTGPVSVAAVLRLAITEFGVQPLRRNWSEILERIESGFHSSIAM
jgi:hypothetical protein